MGPLQSSPSLLLQVLQGGLHQWKSCLKSVDMFIRNSLSSEQPQFMMNIKEIQEQLCD